MKSLSTAHWGRRKADFSFVGFASSSPLCSSASSRGWASSWRTKARTQFYEDLSARPLSGFFLRRFSGLSSSFNQCTSTLKRSQNLEKEVKRPYKGVSASASKYQFIPQAGMQSHCLYSLQPRKTSCCSCRIAKLWQINDVQSNGRNE